MNISSATSIAKRSSTINVKRRLKKATHPFPGPVYRRAGLHALLDDMATIPLIVVNSRSGSGKTTLLADYAERCTSLCLWYAAERKDDLVAVLYGLVVSASQSRLLRNEHEIYWALDEVDAANLVTVRQFFVTLVDQINAPLFIVIDDFQEAQFQDVFHDVLRIACLELPQGSRIVVVDSGTCHLNLTKMRKAFPVAVLEDQDFELSVNEVSEIAKLYGRRVTSPVEARQLWSRVDGCMSCLMMTLNDERSQAVEY